MIIMAYKGVGKRELAKKRLDIIDLDADQLFRDGSRPWNWEEIYVGCAVCLSKQGYIVLISSQVGVQDVVHRIKEPVYAVIPSLKMKDIWVEKLKKRWQRTEKRSDKKEYFDAKAYYRIEIEQIIAEKDIFKELWIIDTMSYDFEEIIENFALETN